jgi:zinc and cadmium transporter
MSPAPLLALFCLLIVFASLLGGWLSSLMRLTHTRMQLMMSFVAGLMLGVGVLHLLPHAAAETESLDRAALWMMVGLLLMFFLIRAFHFHSHGPAAAPDPAGAEDHAHCGHGHHGHDHHHETAESPSHRLSWLGVALGLALHTLIDGVALAASVAAEAEEAAAPLGLFGLGTFLAVALHKPLDALSITTLMAAGGWSAKTRQLVNAGFALMCPLGALFFYFGLSQFGEGQHVLLGCALAFAAGVFVCISLGDLLPELSFHAHDRVKLSVALLLGVALAYGVGYLEPAHTHGHHEHGHHEHGHTHEWEIEN